ncbi:alanine racemase [Pontibacter harenae]|uniref:alanine racemase n=1 Tax=Pontibacter harenae TaxID=2894083 RepID=UPI001E3FCF11|nr:alanine racemase [Pontibacter harenae]MCC9168252.1 alanine racemase [Pontibacter harenae]
MIHSSYIEISKSALQNNLNFLKSLIGPSIKFSSVIKGNAYGHGIEQFAPLAQELGINHFSVFSTDEALRTISSLSSPANVMIMGYIDKPELEWAILNDVIFYVFELNRLQETIKVAKLLKKKAKINLDLETGMNRLGINAAELPQVIEVLQANQEHVQVHGVSTHFAGAESYQNHDRVMQQFNVYNTLVQKFSKASIKPELKHTACSAAVVAYPDSHMDMVRVGIMQYGLWPSPEIYQQYMTSHEVKKDPLQRIISWKSRIMTLKHVAKGEYVGYGTSYQAPSDLLLAVVPVGYAWGYSRSLSNQGHVLVREQVANVIGIINMNLMMIDVTAIPDVHPEDEVVLLGKQGKESITVRSFSELSSQLNYEMLTRLPLNIPRVVVY